MHASTFTTGRQSDVTTIAVDLAKNVFELAFADGQRRVVQRKRLSRGAFAKVLVEHPPVRLVMEACGSAHHWGRLAQRHGHQVRLLPPRDVKPYVRGNNTDRTDVTGMLEADRRVDIHPCRSRPTCSKRCVG